MRGAAISPAALCLLNSSARRVSLPMSRIVVIPHASQILSSYSSGCGRVGLHAGALAGTHERDRVERDHVGNRVVLDDDVLRPAGGSAVAIEDDGVVDQEAADALPMGGSGLREGGRGESEKEATRCMGMIVP